ncbi:MAG: transcriptional regulator [Chlorobi bacterium]|nr:transcriptional regulator [Chlorobiota bacterium]
MVDGIDSTIIRMIQANARVSNTEIARQVGMAPSATLERVRKLEAQGVIRGYKGLIDPKAVGLDLVAFISIRANERVGSPGIGGLLAALPEVQEVHHVAGEDCYLVKVRTANTEELGRLLRGKIGSIDAVTSTRTTIVLETVKETTDLPIPGAEGDES